VQYVDVASVLPAPRLGASQALTDHRPSPAEREKEEAEAAAEREEEAAAQAARLLRASRLDTMSRLRLSHSVGVHGVSGATRYEARKAAAELEEAFTAARAAKDEAEEARSQLETLQAEGCRLQDTVSDAMGGSEAAKAEVGRLQRELERERAERAEAEADVLRERGLREAAEAQASNATAIAAAAAAGGRTDGAGAKMLAELQSDLQDARKEASGARAEAAQLEKERDDALTELSKTQGRLEAATLAAEHAEAQARVAETRRERAEAAKVLAATSVGDAEDKADAAQRAALRAERRAEEAEEEADRARKRAKRAVQELDAAEDTIRDLNKQLLRPQTAAGPLSVDTGMGSAGIVTALSPQAVVPDLMRSSSAGMAIEHTQLQRSGVQPPPAARVSDASQRSASGRPLVLPQGSQRRLRMPERRHSNASTSSRSKPHRGRRHHKDDEHDGDHGRRSESRPTSPRARRGSSSRSPRSKHGSSSRPGATAEPAAGDAHPHTVARQPFTGVAGGSDGSSDRRRERGDVPPPPKRSPGHPPASPMSRAAPKDTTGAAAASGAGGRDAGGVRFAAGTAGDGPQSRPPQLRKVSSFRAEPEQQIEFSYDETIAAPSGLIEVGEETAGIVLRVMVWVDPALVVSKKGAVEPLPDDRERVGFRTMALEGAMTGSRLGGICRAAPPGPTGDGNRRAVLESVLNGLSPGRVWMGKIMAVLAKKKSRGRREKLRTKAANKLVKGIKVAADGINLAGAPGVKLRRVADNSAKEIAPAEPSMEELGAAAAAKAAARAARHEAKAEARARAEAGSAVSPSASAASGTGSKTLQGVTQPAPSRRSRRRSSAPGGAAYLKEMQRAAIAASGDGAYDSN
jgi:hypothetical protein